MACWCTRPSTSLRTALPAAPVLSARHAALSTSAALQARVMYAVKRDYEQEELRRPHKKPPTSRERRLQPPLPKRQRLNSVLGGRATQKGVQPERFPPLEGGTNAALTLLRSQPELYAIVALHQTRHIITPGDLLTVYNLKDTKVGDVIRFTRIEEVGSRDYTLRLIRPSLSQMDDSHYFAPDAVSICGVVVEHTRSKVKYTWRRGYHYRHLRAHVNYFTRIRIGRIDLGEPAALTDGTPADTPPKPFAQTWSEQQSQRSRERIIVR